MGEDPVRILAHWTFIQSQIHIVLANKPAVLKQEKYLLTGTAGDIIRTARQPIGLMQEKLAVNGSVPSNIVLTSAG